MWHLLLVPKLKTMQNIKTKFYDIKSRLAVECSRNITHFQSKNYVVLIW